MVPSLRKQLVVELGAVRERGILRIESPNPRLRLLDLKALKEIVNHCVEEDISFPRKVEKLIRESVAKLPKGLPCGIAEIIFGLEEDLFNPKPSKWREAARDFYADRVSADQGVSLDDFRKGPELEVLGLLAAEMESLFDQVVNHKQENSSAGDILLERSIVHAVRTLETRKIGARADEIRRIDEAVAAFRDWHLSERGEADTIVTIIDRLCERYIDKSVYDIMGSMHVNDLGPVDPPHRELTELSLCYPKRRTFSLVPGGVDPFTGEHVDPFFIALFPVTVIEWHNFLERFHWLSTDVWKSSFPDLESWIHFREFRVMPAFGMTYYDCVAYCFWLWLTTPYKFRLPTEAEWNFAATGGREQAFPWGEGVRHEMGHFSTSPRIKGPAPLPLLKPAGPFGTVSMSGNMWEYVSTLWRGESPLPDSNVIIPDLAFALGQEHWWAADERIVQSAEWRESVKLVMKGGSWALGPEYATVASRIYSSFYNYGGYGGFRLAIDAVRDPATGEYTYAPSPLANPHLRQVRLVSSEDFVTTDKDKETFTIGGGCGGTKTVTRGMLKLAVQMEETSTWEDLLRAKYESQP